MNFLRGLMLLSTINHTRELPKTSEHQNKNNSIKETRRMYTTIGRMKKKNTILAFYSYLYWPKVNGAISIYIYINCQTKIRRK